jgi:hypothetical protein
MKSRFAVRTLVARYDAMNHVRHVLRTVHGLASIRELASCRALRLASVSHAIDGALKAFPVGTNAQAFVVKHVIKTIVTCVPPRAKSE